METEIVYKYYPNGILGGVFQVEKQSRVRHGLQRYYYDNGNLRSKHNYFYGIYGIAESFHEDNTKEYLTQYKKYIEHGFDINFKYENRN